MAEEHDSWVKSCFGFDPVAAAEKAAGTIVTEAKAAGHAVVEGGEALVQKAEELGHEAVDAGNTVIQDVKDAGHAVVEKAKEVVHGAEQLGHAAVDAGKKLIADKLNSDFEAQMKRLDEQIKRLTDAGIDSSHYAAQAKDLRSQRDDALKLPDFTDQASALHKLVGTASDAADRAKADTDRGTTSTVEGIDKAVTDMRDTAKGLIDKLDAKNDQKPELGKRLGELDKQIADEAKITDRAARSKSLKQIERQAEALLDDASAAAKDTTALQATYKKALEDRYGFKVDESQGINSHNDQVYKMFDKVPDTDVTQDKLTKVEYSNKMPDGTANPSAYYYDAGITMGAYDAGSTLPYKDPTSKQPESPNAFSISTLHELGHSVDDRFQIMSAHGAKSGAGAWQAETLDAVAQAYAGRFLAGPGKSAGIDPAVVNASVKSALGGGQAARPGDLSDAAWGALQGLLGQCANRLAAKSPWNTQDDIGGRSYHHSGSGWVSYATASRAQPLSVSDYQWRSPAEYFAELYAWTYFNSRPPPAAVEPTLSDYMYGGKSAGQPAGAH